MVHSGCFLERQYCEFTGTARGQNSREFVARLVARGFARAIEPGPVRRGRLYHVHHKPLYEAIGQADNRNRRLRTIGRMVERVMILDAVLGDRRCWWLSPEADKRMFFDLTRETGLRPEEYPHITFGSGSRRTVRCFPDKLPIGIEKEDTSRFVFLYLVNRRIPVDFRQFLIRHRDLFANLHWWTLRLLVPRRFRKALALYKAAVREELWTPLNPSVSKSLESILSRTDRSRAATSEIHPIATSRKSSESRACRRSRPSIGRGDEQETGCSGSRLRRACATTGRTAVRPSRVSC